MIFFINNKKYEFKTGDRVVQPLLKKKEKEKKILINTAATDRKNIKVHTQQKKLTTVNSTGTNIKKTHLTILIFDKL